MWLNELENLEQEYQKYRIARELSQQEMETSTNASKSNNNSTKKEKKTTKKTAKKTTTLVLEE
jgi:hypothetical protein